jgi:hypothetical protein
LYHAAKAGQLELVQQLLCKDAWRDKPWSCGDKYLGKHFCKHGMGRNFQTLLFTGHPFAAAASQGHTEVCRLLLRQGIHRDVVHVALCRAAAGGHLAVVQLLIEVLQRRHKDNNGPDPGAVLASVVIKCPLLFKDLYGDAVPYPTCLVAAAAGGNPAIVQLLLDLGVPFNQHWEQAIAEATRRGHSEVVNLLISKAPPGYRDCAQTGHAEMGAPAPQQGTPWTAEEGRWQGWDAETAGSRAGADRFWQQFMQIHSHVQDRRRQLQ